MIGLGEVLCSGLACGHACSSTFAFLQSTFHACRSTTSAFAFAANIFSPVPAVQSFGLLLATLVVVNFVLAVTWLPVRPSHLADPAIDSISKLQAC